MSSRVPQVKQKATKTIKGPEHLTYVERLKELDCSASGKEHFGDQMSVYKHLKRQIKSTARLFSREPRNRTRSNGTN